MTRIAIVGMACRYPDATSPRELWENVLAGRRAFRRLPDVRMRLEDYWDPPTRPRRTASTPATPRSSRATSSTASPTRSPAAPSAPPTSPTGSPSTSPRQALADAGFPMGEGLPRDAHRRARRQHADRRVLPGQPAAAALALRAPHGRRRARRSRAGTTTRLADVPRPTSRRPTRARSRRSTRTRWPAGCRTPSPGGSATTSTSRAAATPWTAPAPRRCSPWPPRARRSPPATSTWRSPAGSTSPSTPSRSSASPRPARWPAARCGSTTAARTASGPARAAAWWC